MSDVDERSAAMLGSAQHSSTMSGDGTPADHKARAATYLAMAKSAWRETVAFIVAQSPSARQ